MISAPSEMRCRSIPISDMTKNVAASTMRNGQGDDQAGPPAERQERNHEHDADRLGQRLEKLVDRLADDLRLVRDAAELDADGQILLDALQSLLDGGAHLGDVGAGHHGGAEQHRLPALIARLWRRAGPRGPS